MTTYSDKRDYSWCPLQSSVRISSSRFILTAKTSAEKLFKKVRVNESRVFICWASARVAKFYFLQAFP